MSTKTRLARLRAVDLRSVDVRGYVTWRLRRMKSSWRAARVIDGGRWKFVAREVWPGQRLHDYVYRGKTVRLVHHTEDVAAFKELFVTGVYDLPDGWAPTSPKKIADVGGNIGMFGLYSSIHWPDASVVAFEPEPASASKYRQLIATNGMRCDLFEACAGSSDGMVQFTVGEHVFAHITEAGDGVELPVVDVFPFLDGVDILKMDIEGGEWPIVLDERFRSISADTLMMEYHRHMCPEADPKALISRILSESGFNEIHHIVWNHRTGAGELHARRV